MAASVHEYLIMAASVHEYRLKILFLRPDEQDLVTAWATPAEDMACTKLASLENRLLSKIESTITYLQECAHLVPGDTTG